LKYLKVSQVFYRIVKRFVHPRPNNISCNISKSTEPWVSCYLYEQKIFGYYEVRFLNKVGFYSDKNSWNNEIYEKLWLYNLHYFDDLNATAANERLDIQVELITRWINDNPAPLGNGWEPYPASLRIVNWIKAFLSGIAPEQFIIDSLAKQADFLSQDLERHILGNHLFVNAKALIYAGIYLEGKEASEWLKTGLYIYTKELDEQVLPDGGNFELTPMYHVIMLVDLLDLINLWTAYPKKVSASVVDKTKQVIAKMIEWLKIMSHNDGEISFFNDSAFGIAPKTSVVLEYASKLGLYSPLTDLVSSESLTLFNLQNSGYVSVKSDEYSLIADLAQVGPSYQPGHAHADTLSYEFSLGNQRVFVNSGISEYGLNEERLRQRKTAAHNTVVVNNLDSSQVWSGFRVAKRACVLNRIVNPTVNNSARFSAEHNGFKKQGVNCIHHREWLAEHGSITITDRLIGHYINAIGYLHLHPDIDILNVSDDEVQLASGDYNLYIKVFGADVSIEDTTWHPEFGIIIKNKKLSFSFKQSTMSIVIIWKKK
jgi:uncharacterized heparinase superfamily protein